MAPRPGAHEISAPREGNGRHRRSTDSATGPPPPLQTRKKPCWEPAVPAEITPDRLHCGIRRQPPRLDIVYGPHRRSYAIHIHAGRISLVPGRMEWPRLSD